ncbi:MAG: ROK family protein [Nitrospirae bacterium]|nr:ROK family protein [Nitrospirota bacterium]
MPKDYAIGIDIGGTNLRVASVSRDGSIIKKLKEPTTDNVKDSIKKAVASLMDDNVAGIGIGVAGIIDRKAKRIIVSPNIPSLNGQAMDDIAGGVPVVVENDANAAALGEKHLGAGKDFNNFILMTLGTGIGGGIIYGGKLLNVASEVGHMSLESAGQKCPCGNNGCLELYASARAITGFVTKAIEKGTESILKDYCSGNIYKLTPEDVYKAAFEGDTLSREALKEAGKYLGVGIANLINIMSPDAILLTGGLTGAWDIYIAEAIKEASKRAIKSLFEKVRIIPAQLGDDTGILGASQLVFQEEHSLQS